jgi:hypothetical protein
LYHLHESDGTPYSAMPKSSSRTQGRFTGRAIVIGAATIPCPARSAVRARFDSPLSMNEVCLKRSSMIPIEEV